MKKLTKITEHKREFRCVNCDPSAASNPMDKTQLVEHMKNAHNVTEMKGDKKGLQFLDGADFYSNVYEWKIPSPKGDVKLIEVHSGPKGKGL